jgi:hypothetical protein
MEQHHLNKTKRGYVTMVTIIILVAVASVMITSSILISTENFQASQRTRLALEAKALAETCAEVALNTLKTNIFYTGNVTLTYSYGTCQILTITGSGNTNRTITTQSTLDGVTKKSQIVVQTINPNTVITSWQEIQ